MAIKKDLNALMVKQMDRKEFLKHIGIGIIAVSGVAAMIKMLGSVVITPSTKPRVKTARGYGSSLFGGKG